MMPRPMKPTFAISIPSLAKCHPEAKPRDPLLSRAKSRSFICVRMHPLNSVRGAPAESVDGRALRLVLASDPTGVIDRVQEAEQESIIGLAGARFVASGVVGDLHMRDLRQMRLDRVREFALHSLHMIDVVLQKKIGRADVADDVERLMRARQKK